MGWRSFGNFCENVKADLLMIIVHWVTAGQIVTVI